MIPILIEYFQIALWINISISIKCIFINVLSVMGLELIFSWMYILVGNFMKGVGENAGGDRMYIDYDI